MRFQLRIEINNPHLAVLGLTIRADGQLLLFPINIAPFQTERF